MPTAVAHPHTWRLAFGGIVIIIAAIILAQFFSWTAIAILTCGVVGAALGLAYPEWAIYALAFFAPMSGLAIDFSQDQSLARLPLLGSINAPFVDLLAVGVLVVCWLLFFIRPDVIDLKRALKFSGFFGAFYFCVALSAYFADPLFLGTVVKSFFRPYIFFYLAFAAPVVVLLHSKPKLLRTMYTYELACVLGALMGIVSLFTEHSVGFMRAIPFSVFGFAPFGVNQNVLAESLVAIIPFAWWFAFKQKHDPVVRHTMFFFAGLISFVSLITFSRAAWIVMTMQAVLFFWWHSRYSSSRHAKEIDARGIAIALTVLAIFFLIIQSTVVADTSDETRKDLLGIAVQYFERSPIVGIGPGMYLPTVDETTTFHMDYGAAMDAHGVVQKLILELGALGTITFFAWLGAIGVSLWRRRASGFHFMMFMTFASLWGYQLFNTGYFDAKVWVLMGVALASLWI